MLSRLRVGTKLMVLVLVPVCALFAFTVLAAVVDWRHASELRRFRAATELSFATAGLADAVEQERAETVTKRLQPGARAALDLASPRGQVRRALQRVSARVAGWEGTDDVAGTLDSVMSRLQSLRLQASTRALTAQQTDTAYSLLVNTLLVTVERLADGGPTPASGRAADAYLSLLHGIEAAERERLVVAEAIAMPGSQRARTTDPWATLEATQLDAFRQNAGGRLAAALDAVLFQPASIAVQVVRDGLASDAHTVPQHMSRADWLSASARRLGGLRQLEGNVARAVSATVSHDTMTAQANGIRDLVPALAVLGVVTALGLVVRQSITRPLQEVSDGARRLSSGDLRFGVGYEGDDEIGDVAAALGDLRGTTERLAGEIRSMNTAISESRLDHRADVGAFQGTWSRLLAGMNDTMAAFGGLHSREGALRRVATLVARGVPPEEIFAAVVVEVREHMAADAARLLRYEADGTATLVAASDPGMEIPVGSSMPLDRESSSARLPTNGIGSSVEAPIIVEGRVWGMISAAWTQPPPDSLDAEGRIAQFTELVATAIANAHSTAQLSASRARVVAAADETRRRIERDLHDGVQQRLVSLGLELRNAEATLPGGLAEAHARIQQIVRGLTAALDELRAMSRGIHPAVLSVGGLGTALRTLARRSPVPVELDLEGAVHLPQRVEVAAYYVVSEALTNVAKHAQASVAHVELRADEATVELAIRDDGVGGADPQRGSGLIGLADRVEAIGGRIRVTSRRGAGTSVLVALPLAEDRPVLPAGAFPRWLEAE